MNSKRLRREFGGFLATPGPLPDPTWWRRVSSPAATNRRRDAAPEPKDPRHATHARNPHALLPRLDRRPHSERRGGIHGLRLQRRRRGPPRLPGIVTTPIGFDPEKKEVSPNASSRKSGSWADVDRFGRRSPLQPTRTQRDGAHDDDSTRSPYPLRFLRSGGGPGTRRQCHGIYSCGYSGCQGARWASSSRRDRSDPSPRTREPTSGRRPLYDDVSPVYDAAGGVSGTCWSR